MRATTAALILLMPVVATLFACAARQTVTPVATKPQLVCVAENVHVTHAGTLPALLTAFEARGVQTKVIQATYTRRGKTGFDVHWDPALEQTCPMVATYSAQWAWDITMYMHFADVRLYRGGHMLGVANYDASHVAIGKKWIDAEAKLHELVALLIPYNLPRSFGP